MAGWPDSVPVHKQLLQLSHGPAQLIGECGDFIEWQIELPQWGAGDSGVEGQHGADAVTGDVERAQWGQSQQVVWQRPKLVTLQVQTGQTLQTLHQNKNQNEKRVPRVKLSSLW